MKKGLIVIVMLFLIGYFFIFAQTSVSKHYKKSSDCENQAAKYEKAGYECSCGEKTYTLYPSEFVLNCVKGEDAKKESVKSNPKVQKYIITTGWCPDYAYDFVNKDVYYHKDTFKTITKSHYEKYCTTTVQSCKDKEPEVVYNFEPHCPQDIINFDSVEGDTDQDGVPNVIDRDLSDGLVDEGDIIEKTTKHVNNIENTYNYYTVGDTKYSPKAMQLIFAVGFALVGYLVLRWLKVIK